MVNFKGIFEKLVVLTSNLDSKNEQTLKLDLQALENEYIICTENDEIEVSKEPYKNYIPFALGVLNKFIYSTELEFIEHLNSLYGSDYIEDIFEAYTCSITEIYNIVYNFK